MNKTEHRQKPVFQYSKKTKVEFKEDNDSTVL